MSSLLLHIEGPGYNGNRMLADGSPEMVLGRDTDCHVPLPDPGKTISRRHLAVWNEGGVLRFRVLSVVNGVDLPGGEIPPGAQAVLPAGQHLRLGAYLIHIAQVEQTPAAESGDDPWSVFADSTAVETPLSVRVPTARLQPAVQGDDDPFGDSVFEPEHPLQATYGQGPLLQSAPQTVMSGEMTHFYQGLGLDAAQLGKLSPGELQAAGAVVRRTVEGLLALHAAKTGLRRELKTEEHTMMATSRPTNPLHTDWPLATKLQYLLAGRGYGAGYLSPEAALEESLADLRIHDLAMAAASRAMVEGVLREFEPNALREKLLSGRASLGFLDHARLWDLFAKHYHKKGRSMSDWLRQLADRYFTSAYVRETQRIKRESAKPPHSAG
ncbi:MAG: type VI secretion system-associated FHA domain protein [Burkholderiaceae bacterium]